MGDIKCGFFTNVLRWRIPNYTKVQVGPSTQQTTPIWGTMRSIEALEPPSEGNGPTFAMVPENPGAYILFPRRTFIVTRVRLSDIVGLSIWSCAFLATSSLRVLRRLVSSLAFRSLRLARLLFWRRRMRSLFRSTSDDCFGIGFRIFTFDSTTAPKICTGCTSLACSPY